MGKSRRLATREVINVFARLVRRSWFVIFVLSFLVMNRERATAQDTAQGSLVIEALGDAGGRSDSQAHLYKENTQTPIATVKLGTPVSLPPGTYRLELDVLGGKVTRDKVLIKAGRTSTVIINEVAGLQVSAVDKKGRELGLGVEIYDAVSGQKLGDFLSGETIFMYPGVVDVKIATPPQSQWWRKVQLQGNSLARLEVKERVRGELRVHPLLNGRDVSTATEVIIYQAGTQKEVARSAPSPEHRFALDAGAYDIYVQNSTGKGKPFVIERAEVTSEEPVEKSVPLDASEPAPPPEPPPPTETL